VTGTAEIDLSTRCFAISADLRAAIAVAVARHCNLDRAIVADHRFARIAAAAVATAAAGRIARLASQRRA